jgi:glycosyltransferase involved in cell wall biosynthesis
MNDAVQETNRSPDVSVVVPVYNKAPFLAACLESILAQTVTSLELICVDDGSTDGSSEIIDRFAANECVRVIRQERNRGAAVARNAGLDVARGEFVQFVDADDLLAPDALRVLSVAARTDGVEIVRGGIVGFRSSAPEADRVLDIPRARSGFRPLDDESTWVPWWHTTYLFSRSLLTANGLRYPDLCSGEDPVFLAQVLTRATAMSAVSAVVYRHRLAPLAQKGRTTYRHLRDYLRHAELTREVFLESQPDAWYRGFAPLVLPEIRSMIRDWVMSDAEREAATREMRRVFELPSPSDG